MVRQTIVAFKSLSNSAWQMAIESGIPISLSIDPATRELSLPALHRSERLSREVELSWASALELSSQPSGQQRQASILFLPDGTSSGGELVVRSGNASEAVRISWVSGAAIDAP